MESSTTPNQIHYGHFSEFVRSKDNLREVVEREELLAQIKADGGVKVPGYVYAESKNIKDPETGKSLKVIYDMNSRHWCLEQLAKDSEYLDNGGSLELPYLIISDAIADDPVKERMFMISLGTTNKQLSPKEIGKGYMEALELKIELLKSQHKDWESLSDEDKDSQEKKFKTQILKQIVKESGKSTNEIYKIFRVFGAIEANPELGDAIENNLISVSSADELLKVVGKVASNSSAVLRVAKKAAFDRGQDKVSDKDIETSARIIKHPEIHQFVDNGSIPTNLVEEVLDAASKTKTGITEIVEYSQELGGITKESLKRIEEALIKRDDYFDNDNSSAEESEIISNDSEIIEDDSTTIEEELQEIKEESTISKKDLKAAKDQVMAMAMEMSGLIENKFKSMSPVAIVVLADRLEKVSKFLQKNSK